MELEKSIKEEIALIALTIGAVEINTEDPFLTNGYYNPIHYDCDEFLFRIRPRKLIADEFYRIIRTLYKKNNNLIIAGYYVSWSTLIAAILDVNLIFINKNEYVMGTGNIKKDLSGNKVVLIQDTITNESILSVDTIRKANGICDLCITVIDFGFPDISRKLMGEIPYEEDAFYKPIYSKKLLSPCEVKSLIDLPLILRVAIKNNFIKSEEEKTILEWAENRQNWGKEHGFPPPIKRV